MKSIIGLKHVRTVENMLNSMRPSTLKISFNYYIKLILTHILYLRLMMKTLEGSGSSSAAQIHFLYLLFMKMASPSRNPDKKNSTIK